MAQLKYSRQRASIMEYMAHTKEHPTADMVYLHVRKEFPNISLGTVYRNLNLLAERGDIRKISVPDGGDRFDGRMEPHSHVVCSTCGEVFDLDLDSVDTDAINRIADEHFDGCVEGHTTLFFGTCPDCLKKQQKMD